MILVILILIIIIAVINLFWAWEVRQTMEMLKDLIEIQLAKEQEKNQNK